MVFELTMAGSADGFKQTTGMAMEPAFLNTFVAEVMKVSPAPDGWTITTVLLGASNGILFGDGANRSTPNCTLVTSPSLRSVTGIPKSTWPGAKFSVPLLLT